MIDIKETKTVQELIVIVMTTGASILVVFIIASGLIYRYLCGFGQTTATPQPDPQSLKQTDATALELANNMDDQESPDKQENPERRETDHESLDQIS